MRLPIGFLLVFAFAANAQERYSREKEVALGAALARQLQRTTAPLDSPAGLDYVQRLGVKLSSQLPDPRFSYTFALIASDESNALHEPLSFPGGYILVPASLFLAAQDEAEFAGMLAHSMAHAAARRGTPFVIVGGWAGWGSRETLAGVPLSFARSEAASELDADLLAVTLTSAAGYDPKALVRYITRVWPDRPPDLARDTRIAALKSAINEPAASSSSDEFLRIRADILLLVGNQ